MWVPLALPIDRTVSDRNLATILTMPLLYLEFLLLLVLWGRFVEGSKNLFKIYGFRQPTKFVRNLLQGVGVGVISVLLMFAIQGGLGWVVWQAPQPTLLRIVLEGGLVAIAYGFAEELLFRGWLLHELEHGYSEKTALWASSIIFSLVHLGPIQRSIQLPALVLLGMILVWAKRASSGRLGLAVGLHGGLIWGWYIINVGQLVTFPNAVPEWVTGIGRNPLAGIVGLIGLSAIALWVRSTSRQYRPHHASTR